MKALNRILAATDFSGPARSAVARAFDLAAGAGAQLTLTHVLSQGALDGLRRLVGIEPAVVQQSICDDAQARLAQLADELGRTHGVQAATRLATGTVLPVLQDEADALDADLLVVGARGEDVLGRLLLGTTAERLLRQLRRPVLMVRKAPRAGYRRVLVPVDFSAWSAPAIRAARTIAPGAELTLLNAFVAPFESRLRMAGVEDKVIDDYLQNVRQEATGKLQSLVAAAGLQPRDVRCSVRHGDAAHVVLLEAQAEDCDLIVMGKHGRGIVEEFLLGSVTKHVLAESEGDVLVIGVQTA